MDDMWYKWVVDLGFTTNVRSIIKCHTNFVTPAAATA